MKPSSHGKQADETHKNTNGMLTLLAYPSLHNLQWPQDFDF